MTDCGHQCHEIGGPWISFNPDCPVHGYEAQRIAKEAEEEAAKPKYVYMVVNKLDPYTSWPYYTIEATLADAQATIAQLLLDLDPRYYKFIWCVEIEIGKPYRQ